MTWEQRATDRLRVERSGGEHRWIATTYCLGSDRIQPELAKRYDALTNGRLQMELAGEWLEALGTKETEHRSVAEGMREWWLNLAREVDRLEAGRE